MNPRIVVVFGIGIGLAGAAGCGASDGRRAVPPDTEAGAGGSSPTFDGGTGGARVPGKGGAGGASVPGNGGSPSVDAGGGAGGAGERDATSDGGAPPRDGASTHEGGTKDASTDSSRDTGGAHAGPLVLATSFPAGSNLCGMGYDQLQDRIWVYPCFGATVQSYSSTGTALGTVTPPGGTADDVDVDFAQTAFMLGTTLVPEGTMLFFNGEAGTLDVYGVGAESDGGSAQLTAAFGASHVVGGAFHPTRNTLFALQDKVPAGAVGNIVAEIDPVSGATKNSFSIAQDFVVNYGDLDVCHSTGNLFVVSSDQTTIAEYTPAGVLVGKHPLPAGVTSLSGIGIDDLTGAFWVVGTTGTLFRMTNTPCPPFVEA